MGVRGATPLQRFCLFLSVCDSQDILNNLHSPGVEEVDDDDLMLDVDLPEDGLHGELTHLVVLEQKNIQPSQWQKKSLLAFYFQQYASAPYCGRIKSPLGCATSVGMVSPSIVMGTRLPKSYL